MADRRQHHPLGRPVAKYTGTTRKFDADQEIPGERRCSRRQRAGKNQGKTKGCLDELQDQKSYQQVTSS